MKSKLLIMLFFLGAVYHQQVVYADDGEWQCVGEPVSFENVIPLIYEKSPHRMEIYKQKAEKLRGASMDYVFLGDSIVDRMPENFWKRLFPKANAINLGIGGDTTEGLLWRIQNLHRVRDNPVFIVLIGTNDVAAGMPEKTIASHIAQIIQMLHHTNPKSRILLFGLLPRSQYPREKNRQIVENVNKLIQSCMTLPYVEYVQFDDLLLNHDGTLPRNMASDFLHLTPEGYDRIFDRLSLVLSTLPVRTH
jgi:lysophospholipase L1-like esterase